MSGPAAMVRDLFWNRAERRLRLSWRLALHSLLLAVLYFGGLVFLTPIVASAMAGQELTAAALSRVLGANPLLFALTSAAGLVAIAASVALAGRFIDRRRLAIWFQIDAAWRRDFAFGLALGAALMALVFLVQLAAGSLTIVETLRHPPDFSFGAAFLLALIGFVCVGIYEELLMRGYYLKNLAEGLGALGPTRAVAAATLLSSAVFGVAHATNPNATLLSTLLISFAGLFLALGTVLTGRLAISIGLHITWNWAQGNVFGFPVSGLDVNATTLIAVRPGGDPLVTGGAFGPEAGLIGLGAMVLGSLLIVAWVRRSTGRVAVARLLAIPQLVHAAPEERIEP